jgi:hypothetical protein
MAKRDTNFFFKDVPLCIQLTIVRKLATAMLELTASLKFASERLMSEITPLKSAPESTSCLRPILIFFAISMTSIHSAPAQTISQGQYEQLPQEIRNTVRDIRDSCKENDPDFKPYAIDQGITIIDLDGSGSRDVMLDAENVCNGAHAGANCSNRGCDLKIWKQFGRTSWHKVFDEHLYRKFISLSENNRFRMMAVSIFGGNPHCKPDTKRDYTSGQSCDALVYFRNNSWSWQTIQ